MFTVLGGMQQRMKKFEAKERKKKKKECLYLFQIFLTMSVEKPRTNDFIVYV